MAITLPGQNIPVDMPGQVNPHWYELFMAVSASINAGPSVDPSFTVAPISVGNDTVSISSPTTLNFTQTPTGNVNPTLVISTTQPFADMAQTFITYINTLRSELISAGDVINALNTRITALENKENEVISDLDARFP